MSFSKPSMDYGDARITPALVAEVQSIIDGQGGSLTKFNRIMAIFASKKITYKAILSVWDVLVHPDNRSGLGLNVFDCHKTLKSVKITGAALNRLRSMSSWLLAAAITLRSCEGRSASVRCPAPTSLLDAAQQLTPALQWRRSSKTKTAI